jgi:hypothetical protein
MSADRGRVTHYAPRKYREIISQQGRVVLEADANEGQRIFTEEVRREALDVVGPCGTPDDGYEVVPAAGDLTITKGTMYVGGLRMTLDADISYTKQPDWLDVNVVQPWADGLWRDPLIFLKSNVQASLVLREQEITAVEDPALREVALGGPDTAARTRILQRVVTTETFATNCANATGSTAKVWPALGLVHEPATAELRSRARLQVTPVAGPPPASPCDPPAASGYLGADNQMIRVQVTTLDGTGDAGTLLWGNYNASTLYRATVQSATTVKLATHPVSAEYQPRTGQVAQVLLRAADLGEGAFAAALTGHFAKLTTPYAVDTQIVTLPAALPQPPYSNTTNVYVRLWDDQVNFTVGTPVVLGGTGLQVTITRDSAGRLHIGDYWCIGVRPLTPNAVYPERLLTAPQPPDGPRMWACPLAVLQGGKPPIVLEDCRRPFDNLVELTARKSGDCACTVCVTPEAHAKDSPSLQKAIDLVIKAGGGTVCLEPGTYKLPDRLLIVKARSLTIAGKGVSSQLLAGQIAIEVRDSTNVSLEAFSIQCRGDKEGSAVFVHSSSEVRMAQLAIENLTTDGAAIGLSGALTGVAVRDTTLQAPVGIVDVPDPKVGGTGLVDLAIEGNQFLCERSAIRLTNVTVHQHLTRIAGNRIRGCRDTAIVLTGATVPGFGVEVIGNDLEIVGVGIAAGVDGLRIADNDLFPAEGNGKIGIVLVTGATKKPLEDGQIAGNRIDGFEIGIAVSVALGSFAIEGNQIANAIVGLQLEGERIASFAIEQNQMRNIREIAIRVQTTDGRIAVRGNQLEILVGSPGVLVSCPRGDCLYADNHSSHLKPAGVDGVMLSGRTLIVTSNRVLGKVRVNLDTAKKALCTAVGNVTGADIVLDGAPLPAPWAPLNLQGV